MRVTEILNEAFDTPYRIKPNGTGKFVFTTEMNNSFEITFFVPQQPSLWFEYQQRYFPKVPRSAKDVVEVEFILLNSDHSYKYLGGDEKISDIGDNTMRIFATVLNTIMWYGHTKNVDLLFFTGERKLGSVYARMIRRYLPSGYTVINGNGADSSKFMIYKKDIPLE